MTTKTLLIIVSLFLISSCSMFTDKNQPGVRKRVDKGITEVKVFISKERVQCEDTSGRPLAATKAQLTDAGIDVFESSCALIKNQMSPALCGAATLYINIHSIDSKNLPQAQELGFASVETLGEGDEGYDAEECENN